MSFLGLSASVAGSSFSIPKLQSWASSGRGNSLTRLAPPVSSVSILSKQRHDDTQASIQRELVALNSRMSSDTEMGGIPVASVAMRPVSQLSLLRPPSSATSFALERRATALVAEAALTKAEIDSALESRRVAAAVSVIDAPPPQEWEDDSLPVRDLSEVIDRGHFTTPRTAAMREPLSRKDSLRVADALAAGEDDECLMSTSIAGIKLSRFDMRTLRPGAWLNDEVMNLYFELILRRHKAFMALRDETIAAHTSSSRPGPPPPKLRPIHVFTSFFWVKLNQVCDHVLRLHFCC